MFWFLSDVARAGLLVGATGSPAPLSDATRILTWREGGDTVAVFQQASVGAGQELAWLTPVPRGLLANDARTADPDLLAQLDRWSGPLVLAPTCADVVTDQAAGCDERARPLPEIATDRTILAETDVALGGWAVELLDTGDADGTIVALQAWMVARDLVFPPGGEDAMLAAGRAGDVFVAAEWIGDAPPNGAWLPPLRIRWTQERWDLPLRSADANTVEDHDTVVWAVTTPTEGRAEPPNYVPAFLEDRCMPPAGTPEDWYEVELDTRLPGELLPKYAVEFSRTLDDPGAPDLSEVGPPAGGIVSRVHMRYAKGALDQDLLLEPTGDAEPVETAWYVTTPELEWALPVCGEGFREDPGTCPGVKLASRSEAAGCATGSGRGAGWGALALAAAFVARRRKAGLALALLASGPARADEGLVPRYAVAFQAPVWSTVRLGDEDTGARGAPSIEYPTIGFDGRIEVASTGATSLGATAGLRGWAGRATTDITEVYVLSTLIEPSLGLSVTHGRMGERWATPTLGYGAALAAGVVHSTAYRAVGSLGPLLHVRAGAWLGRATTRRTEVALQVSGIPRSDARVVDFAPETGIPGFRYFPGTANVTITLGGVFGVR